MRYQDANGTDCVLSFTKGGCPTESRHVLVISRYEGDWILTDHRERGLEFPGGKAEPGETLEEAAAREVYEETGAVVKKLEWFAEYEVKADPPFCKTVFLSEVERIEPICLMETKGLVRMKELPLDERFSFLMRDKGMETIVEKVIELGQRKQ